VAALGDRTAAPICRAMDSTRLRKREQRRSALQFPNTGFWIILGFHLSMLAYQEHDE
jgi:hypothetical protein